MSDEGHESMLKTGTPKISDYLGTLEPCSVVVADP